ncbi:MAG: cobaltochelatase subunit CobN [Tissierellia bacterium]|nr:cobaltochelatase subunit CobN [Tissierellia bacterium]
MKIIGIIHGDTKLSEFRLAAKNLEKEIKEIEILIYNVKDLNEDETLFENLTENIKTCEAYYMSFHGSCAHLNKFLELSSEIKDKYIYYDGSIDGEFDELYKKSKITLDEFLKLKQYFDEGGIENSMQFLKLLLNFSYSKDYIIEDINKKPSSGIYYKGRIYDEIEAESFVKEKLASNKPIIGVMLHLPFIINSNTLHADSIIEKLEELGAAPICVFGRLGSSNGKGIIETAKKYFLSENKTIVDAIVTTTGYAISNYYIKNKDYIQSIFEEFNVAIVQAISVYLSGEEFLKSASGIDIPSLSLNVYQPEMDGQIISVPCAVSEKVEIDGVETKKYFPIDDRIEIIAKLAINFANLRRKVNGEKKIALILHNYPPRNDMIGSAHGLDTPQSLYKLLAYLKENGYVLELDFKNGQEIIEELINRGANDWRFASKDIKKSSAGQFDKEEFQERFKNLPDFNKKDLAKKWGDPLGNTMVLDGSVMVPGIIDKNIFIGLQPRRSSEENLEKEYHSTHNPPPYSYLAYYKWIEEVFKADAIIHIGTHGTLEWLPGKEVALSKESYPDLNIYSMAHFYIYNLGILGEGMQARRRSHATILSHLIPAMTEAGTYEYLEQLEETLEKYEHAKKSSPMQVGILLKEIIDIARKNYILKDLNLEDIEESEYEKALPKIHNWVHMLKNTTIRDGLHIYGSAPKNERYLQMIKGLSSLSQMGVMALTDAMLIAMGEDPKKILKELSDEERDNTKNYQIYEKANTLSTLLIEDMNRFDFKPEYISEKIFASFAKTHNTKELLNSMNFIAKEIVPALNKCSDEKTSFIRSLDGEFINPSLGGNPTRGNIKLLPTGRNFYSINPEEVPSKAAYDIGKNLGEKQLNLYFKEHNEYPDSIAIIVYATNTMKTYGEDIGEIFYLMGVEPIYLGNTKTVMGVRPIPLERLGRPRVDVMLRISGLFRDAFPNLIQLMDEAVSAVAFLDEPEEMNPIKRNIKKEIERLVKEGIDYSEAIDRAKVRVFGSPAGSYGAGVSDLIESKNWQNVEDLGDAYILWSSHGYSNKFHGENLKPQFFNILKNTKMTIKNEVSNEIDLLDSDDFYNYHGGLIAAVRKASNKKPKSIVGNTANPDLVEARDLESETSKIMRTKVLNPKWLEGLKPHGYKGAQEISKTVDIIFGWDVTSDNIEDWMYDGVCNRFLLDEEVLSWIKSVNKTAAYQMSERLLEANQRGMWNADEETINRLRNIYLEAEGSLEKIID